uniref:Uncharacterized protein n=1 Tax=Rhizophora mucronata TaxID=61149 RepID=A0A2P2PLC6_RHIMU
MCFSKPMWWHVSGAISKEIQSHEQVQPSSKSKRYQPIYRKDEATKITVLPLAETLSI